MRTRLLAGLAAGALLVVTASGVLAAPRLIPSAPAQGVHMVEDQGFSLTGDREGLERVLAEESPINFKILVIDDVADGEDRTAYLDRVAEEWDDPQPDTLLLIIFTQGNNDIRFFMGANFRRAEFTVEQMLDLVRTVYQPKVRTGDAAGALADFIDQVNRQFVAQTSAE